MKMDEMNEAFERKGFDVTRHYISDIKTYYFTIRKDGVLADGEYQWDSALSNGLNNHLQKRFIANLIETWERRSEKHSETVSDVFDTLDDKQKTVVYAMIGHMSSGLSILPDIEKVTFNPPATIVFWSDGTKTIVKCQDGDSFDPERGLTTAISKKALGNKGNYNNEIRKWLDKCDIHFENVVADPITGAAYNAYQELLNVFKHSRYTKLDLEAAINEAIGYLGEVLAE